MKHLSNTGRNLGTAIELANEAMAAARAPYEAEIASAERKLDDAQSAAVETAQLKAEIEAEQQRLNKTLKQLRSGQPLKGLEDAIARVDRSISVALTVAEEALARLDEELEAKELAVTRAHESLMQVCAPIQLYLDLCAALEATQTSLTAEAGEVEQTIARYFNAEMLQRRW
jgi:chromosome segregation ATPase